MNASRKRSISPHSMDHPPVQPSKFKKIWSFFTSADNKNREKQVKFKSSYETDISTADKVPYVQSHYEDSYYNNSDIISDKRRKISIQQTNELRGYIPRSSVDHSKTISNYGNYLSKLQEENNESEANLERRATIIPEDSIDEGERFNSPIPDMNEVRRQSMQMINNLENNGALERFVNDVDTTPEEESDTESFQREFAPLYTDDEGNLVRPPFINLAPRERYKLLQLKRSIETSRELQLRLKYMVNPNETRSILLDNNKVETSTQTQDANYLKKRLHFNDFQKSYTNTGPATKKQRPAAVFSGEFFYDIEDEEPKQSQANKFNGYLGNVSKPKFKSDKGSGRREFTQDTQVSLDSEYVSKSEKISDIIKLKESKVNKKSAVEPSSGFKFSINKDDINDIINKRKEGYNLLSNTVGQKGVKFALNGSAAPASTPKAPSEESELKITPKFNFGGTSNTAPPTKSPSLGQSEKKTGFTFGASSAAQRPASATNEVEEEPRRKRRIPSSSAEADDKSQSTIPTKGGDFKFGTGETSTKPTSSDKPDGALKFSFGDSNSSKSEKPAFSFGASEKKDTPGFSLGASSQASKPSFNFGSLPQKNEKTANIGPNAYENKDAVPKFGLGSTGTKDEAPKFSFGSTTSEKKDETLKISLSSEKKDESPKFIFGSSEKKDGPPKFSFAAENKEATPNPGFGKVPSEKKAEAPKFSFGQAAPPATSSTFSFGPGPGTVDPKDSDPKSIFGASSSNSISSAADKKESTSNFTFGAGASKTVTPSASVTATIGSDKPETTPGFQFGGATENKQSTPFALSGVASADKKEQSPSTFGANPSGTATSSFNFGATTKPTVSATPSVGNAEDRKSPFNFGSTQKPSFNFGSSQIPTLTPSSAALNPLGGSTNQVPTSTSPFQFGSVEKPSLAGAATSFSGGFANGITPVKPVIPNSIFGNREGTPGQFNSGGSRGTTPEIGFGAQQNFQGAGAMGMPINSYPGFNPSMTPSNMNMNFGAPDGLTPVNPLNNPANRPNRKFAKMRKRRT
ncbi:hypothetical protein PSN45_000767 [Yamadazyma tenuis]|uniref:uncharacterized protein n=1 Tax=Candida tenuis TaxID=2315449 RepID=UPI002798185D|nr:hypothetical protein PSN45_000767 [Yamadazyma tenuis]